MRVFPSIESNQSTSVHVASFPFAFVIIVVVVDILQVASAHNVAEQTSNCILIAIFTSAQGHAR